LRISVRALAAFLLCIIAIFATNAATFYAFPRYVTRTTVLAVPITVTATSVSTTVSTATAVSYWTVTTVSTTTAAPYPQYYWWQNPYLPTEATTTLTSWIIITQPIVVTTTVPGPGATTTTQTATTSIPTTVTTTTTLTTTTVFATTTTTLTQTTTTTAASASHVGTTLSLGHIFVSGFTGNRRFNGYLKEEDTGNPVAGRAIVLTVLSGGNGMTFTATTNGQGYYEYLFTGNGGIFTWAEARFNGSGPYLSSFSGRVYA